MDIHSFITVAVAEETSSRSGSSPGSNTETVAVLRGAAPELPTVDQLEGDKKLGACQFCT